MEVFPPELWDSRALSGPSSNTLVVYFGVRHCINTQTIVTVDLLAQKFQLSPSRINASLRQLKTMGWITPELGVVPVETVLQRREYSTSESPSLKDSIDQVAADLRGRDGGRRLVDETNSILTERATKDLKKPRKKKSATPAILEHFKFEYSKKFREPYTPNQLKSMMFCKRLLTWADNDADAVRAIITFYIEHWDEVKHHMGDGKGFPTLPLLATGTIWQMIRGAMKDGFPNKKSGKRRTLLNRYREDDSPTSGFGEEDD